MHVEDTERGGAVSSLQGQTETSPCVAFFGFEASDFVEQAFEATSVYSQDGLKQMQDILLEDSETQSFKDDIDHGFSVARSKLQRTLERNFDKLELYAQRNILRVPAHIDTTAMPALINESGSFLAHDEEVVDSQIAELRHKIQTAQYVKNAMAHRLAQYTEELAACAEVLDVLLEGDRKTAEAGMQDLSAAVTSVIEAGKDIAALEGQYASMTKDAIKGENNSIATGGTLDNCLAKCRADLGAPSSKELRHLGLVLGVETHDVENCPPAVM